MIACFHLHGMFPKKGEEIIPIMMLTSTLPITEPKKERKWPEKGQQLDYLSVERLFLANEQHVKL